MIKPFKTTAPYQQSYQKQFKDFKLPPSKIKSQTRQNYHAQDFFEYE